MRLRLADRPVVAKRSLNDKHGQIVNRCALLKEVETDTAALMESVGDDLALQFDGTDEGKRFVEAWKRACVILDTGGGHTPPTPQSASR